MRNEELKYIIGVTLLEGVGDVIGKNLIAHCGSAEAVFKEKKHILQKIPDVGSILANSIVKQNVLQRAEEEVNYCLKNNITITSFLDNDYPEKLKHCIDSPLVLYSKGKINFENKRILSVVGTRKATDYGKRLCEKIIEDLKDLNIVIVSGLAFGIDICAHKIAYKNNLQTVGVLAGSLEKIYPAGHRKDVNIMLENGGIISEFRHDAYAARENFPKRNRIVAGIADATLVVESARKGGSLISAEIANSYSRDVFAVPGRIGDKYSEGCNYLIKTNRAALVTSAQDICRMMSWEADDKPKKSVQKQLFLNFTPNQQLLIDILNQQGKVGVDTLGGLSKLPTSSLASELLTLEFQGAIRSLPGKMYELS